MTFLEPKINKEIIGELKENIWVPEDELNSSISLSIGGEGSQSPQER